MTRFPIPSDALDDRLGFIGTSGSGKTYNAGGAVERLLKSRARVVIVDPLGVWWGLRLLADGKAPSPFSVAIFGGPHGDLPLNEHAGALIGETAATMAESCIIDLCELGSKAADRRFMTAFLETIYRKANGEPFHLVVDEADLFAPQKPPKGDETLLNLMEQIVRRGRVKGFIPWLISQRPAVLNKNVLSQVDGLIAFKLTATQDRNALDGWIEGQADEAQGKAIKDSLPAMQIGTGVVWVPGRGVLETASFPEKETFDSSRTPKRGEKKRKTAELKPLDLGALKERLATVVAETKANDPKELKAEIARLRAEAKMVVKAQPAADPQAVKSAYDDGFTKGKTAALQALGQFARNLSSSVGRAKAETERAESLLASYAGFVESMANEVRAKMPAPRPAPVAQRIEHRPPKARVAGSKPAGSANGSLPVGERAVLIAAAQFGKVERTQLTILTGYKRSTRDAYVARLREKGYLDLEGTAVLPTDAGVSELGDFEPLPQGVELQAYWLGRLPEGERKILEALLDAYPNAVDNDDLSDITGYKRSTRDAYLSRMEAKRIIARGRGETSAARELFE